MRILLLLCLLPVLCLGQYYIEAFGQTQPFHLTDGQTTSVDLAGGPDAPALSLSISPNPSNGGIHFKAASVLKGKVVVFAVSGRKTGEVLLRAGQMTSFNRLLPNGIYIARLKSEGKTLLTKRFLVVR
jgi:hypothetical protein